MLYVLYCFDAARPALPAAHDPTRKNIDKINAIPDYVGKRYWAYYIMKPLSEVKPLAREMIDAWPVHEAGLPARAVRRLMQRGVLTLGALRTLDRAALAGLRGLGVVTLNALDTVFARCASLEAGRPLCTGLAGFFEMFLIPAQREVLALRYGLQNDAAPVTRPGQPLMTLQAVATRYGLTRERIRQVEARARAALGSRLAQAGLAPFYGPLDACIRTLGGAATAAEIDRAADPVFCAGYSPARVLGVVGPMRRPPLTFTGGFTAVPRELLARLESETVAYLRLAGGSQSFDAVRGALQPWLDAAAPFADSRALPLLLGNLAAVSVTRSGLCFIAKRGAKSILLDVLRNLGGTAHYRAIQNAYNADMRPGSRKGTGTLLALLSETPGVTAIGGGMYRLETAETPRSPHCGEPAS
jgi:hypothetical protein